MLLRICHTCGKEFETRASGAKFCSVLCNYTSHVIKNDFGCWGWRGSTSNCVYGQIVVKRGVWIKAHRFSYEHFVGPIPVNLNVLHKCDNPVCSNPAHLFIGTQKDNVTDMRKKGRHKNPPVFYGDLHPARLHPKNLRRGSEHPNAILNELQVEEIILSKETSKIIAPRYGISAVTVRAIRIGTIWRHVHQKLKSTPNT